MIELGEMKLARVIGDAEVGGQRIETGTQDAEILKKDHNGEDEQGRWELFFNHNFEEETLETLFDWRKPRTKRRRI